MENINIMRHLRLEHGVSLTALAAAAGVSVQRISEIETFGGTENNVRLIQQAFETVIEQRKSATAELEAAYQRNCGQLFRHVKEWDYGI